MRNFFSRFFKKGNSENTSSPIIEEEKNVLEVEEEINVLEIEEDISPDQDEEVEFVGLHESALREDPKFQLLENEKKKSNLLREAIQRDQWEKDQTEKKNNLLDNDDEIQYVGFHESVLRKDPTFLRLGEGKKRTKLLTNAIQRDLRDKQQKEFVEYLKDPFVVPEGMTIEEATREMIRKDAEKYNEGANSPPPEKEPSIGEINFAERYKPDNSYLGTSRYSGFSRPRIPSEPYVHTGKRGGKYYLVRSKVSGRVYRQYTK